MTFDDAFDLIISAQVEGEISHDPQDPGNAGGSVTKWGISSVWYPQAKEESFTKEDAKQIYRTDFWNRFQCDKIGDGKNLIIFDCGVNQTQQAPRLIQRAVGVTDDGVIGPATIAAIKKMDAHEFVSEFAARRAVAYASNPLFTRDGLGWSRRLQLIAWRSHQDALNP